MSGIGHALVCILSLRRYTYSISAHISLFGLWHLCVAVSNSMVGVVLMAANASRCILALIWRGIILIASHSPPVSPIALEYGSVDDGESGCPPYLMYAITSFWYCM